MARPSSTRRQMATLQPNFIRSFWSPLAMIGTASEVSNSFLVCFIFIFEKRVLKGFRRVLKGFWNVLTGLRIQWQLLPLRGFVIGLEKLKKQFFRKKVSEPRRNLMGYILNVNVVLFEAIQICFFFRKLRPCRKILDFFCTTTPAGISFSVFST